MKRNDFVHLKNSWIQKMQKNAKIPSPAIKRTAFMVLLFTLVIEVTGCSHTASVHPPTPLPQMTQTAELERQWQLLLGRTTDAEAVDLRIALDENRVYSAATEGWLSAMWQSPKDRWTDQVIWQKKLNELVTAGPVIHQQTLYFGTNKGSLYALDKVSGRLLWQKQLSSEVIAPPVIHQGRLFTRTVDGKLYALNAQTGAQIWEVEHLLPNLSLRGAAPVTVTDDRLFIGWESGEVEALSPASGARLWTQRILTPQGRTDLERMVDLQAKLVLHQGRLIVLGYHGKLEALNPKTGLPYWVKNVSGYRSPLVNDQGIFLVTDQDIVQSYDLQTGALRWQQKQLRYRHLSELAFFNDQILIGDGYGTIERLDPIDGTLLGYFTHEKDTAIVGLMPAQEEQVLYVQDADGYITRYQINPTDFATQKGHYE